MANFSSWHDEDEDLYSLQEVDPLGVLTSAKIVVASGESVWINTDQIESFCDLWLQESTQKNNAAIAASTELSVPPWDETYHFFDGTEQTVNWLVVLDALNFCFWAEKDQTRWSIEYHGETLNGYWAEAAALKRAVEEDHIPLWDANYLSTISEETLAHIFRGTGTIPLFEQRVNNAREVGRVLLERFDGQFARAIEQAEYNAVKLVLSLAAYFPSFHDVTTYRTHSVSFLKRAQICIADIYGSFKGKSWGAFTNLDQLSIFADYKLPQVLRHYNILGYNTDLAQRVDNQELIESGSEEEVEIRANTVWACELLLRTMRGRGKKMTAADVDLKLWLLGQQSETMRPYHRTRTIYY